MTRVTILEGDVLKPGEEGLIQFRLEDAAVALPEDRFVIRSYSPMTTIGGGYIIDPLPRKHRRNIPAVIDQLTGLENGDPRDRVQVYLEEAGEYGLEGMNLSVRTGLEPTALEDLLAVMVEAGEIVIAGTSDGTLVYSSSSFEMIKDKLLKALEKFHRSNPAKAGIGREELRMKVARQLPDRPYRNLLAALREHGAIILEGDIVRIGSHEATLTPHQKDLAGKVIGFLDKTGLSPPFVTELVKEMKASPAELKLVLNLLADRGDLVRIKDDYFVTSDAHAALLKGVSDYFESSQEMALADFREIVDTTRKWIIPLLEYLDRTLVTMRKGDVRIKRGTVKREQ
jgi:selenocysteine-specific elongation factor